MPPKTGNASAASCHRGYRLFYFVRSRGHSITLELLNARLDTLGFDPVSQRTFDNYAKNWAKHNLPEDYVPINRMDYGVDKDNANVPEPFIDGGRD